VAADAPQGVLPVTPEPQAQPGTDGARVGDHQRSRRQVRHHLLQVGALAARARPRVVIPGPAGPHGPDGGQGDLGCSLVPAGAAQVGLVAAVRGASMRVPSTAKTRPRPRRQKSPAKCGILASEPRLQGLGQGRGGPHPGGGEDAGGRARGPMRVQTVGEVAGVFPACPERLALIPGHPRGDPGQASRCPVGVAREGQVRKNCWGRTCAWRRPTAGDRMQPPYTHPGYCVHFVRISHLRLKFQVSRLLHKIPGTRITSLHPMRRLRERTKAYKRLEGICQS